tara:strand:- start:158 stop:592 length:435 start_codon:yes stop_codon:yes gene_type:complete
MKHFIALLLLFCFTACSNNNHSDLILELDKNSIVSEPPTNIIFIPVRGCSVCVGKAFNFLKEHLDSDMFTYILFNHESQKEIKIRLHLTDMDLEKIHFLDNDITTSFYKTGISNFYPTIVKIHNDEVTVQVADPYHLDYWDELK